MISQVNLRRAAGRVLLTMAVLLGSAPAMPASPSRPPSPARPLAELSLEDLMEVRIEKVVSASRFQQNVTRAPATVTVVSAHEIARFGHRTLADVLQSVRGIYVANDRNYSYLGMRGFLRPGDYNTRVLTLLDGHRMNDNVYDAAGIGYNNVPDIDLVERVEIVRGPSSSVYGSSAFFGVVNVVSKAGRDFDGPVVSTEVGSLGTFKARLTYGRGFRNGADWLFSASLYQSDGGDIYFPEFDQRFSGNPAAASDGFARNRDGESALDLYGRGKWSDVTISFYLNRRAKDVPTASFRTAFNESEATTDLRSYLDAKYERAFETGARLFGRLYFDAYRYDGRYPYNYAERGEPPLIVQNVDGARGQWTGTEWQWDAMLSNAHHLVLGGEYRQNLRQDQFNYDLEPRLQNLRLDASGRTAGLYAQMESMLHDRLILNAGLRHDTHFGTTRSSWSPRLALIFSPHGPVTVKAIHGRAFRAPNVYERSYYSRQKQMPTLRPETIETTELVWEQYLDRTHRISASLYHYDVESLIGQVTLPSTSAIVFENVDRVRTLGAEFEFEASWDNGSLARFSFAAQRAEDRQNGRELTNSPRRLARLNLLRPFASRRLSVGVELQHASSVGTLDGSRLPDTLLTNLTLTSTRLFDRLELSASVYNLFDLRYSVPGAEDHLQDAIPQLGRSLRVKATYRF